MQGKGKRRILLVLVFILLIFCGFTLSEKERDNVDEWRPGKPLGKDLLKVGIIHLTNPENETSGYSYSHEVGIKEMQRNIALSDDQIIRKVNVYDIGGNEAEHAIRECIANGANVIIATSWGYRDVCEKLAREYPGVIFAHASGNKSNDSNFTNYFGRIYKARYLSGIVAGLRTETNKIGFVAAMGKDNSEVTGGLDAFAMGVESVNPDARIYVRVLERWYDPNGETQSARSLIALGCDVIAQHSDTSNPQIEAQKEGVWGIGYSSDMSGDAPDATLVSVIWNWGVYYTSLMESIIDGSFTTTPYFGGISEDVMGLTPLNERILPLGVAEEVSSAARRIAIGEFGVFDGVMETNDGRFVGEEGKTLPDSEITGGIHWYYRNIIEP
jgi:basic membrane protein A